MFQKIKKITEEFRQRDRKILSATLENGWANVYHDSIRGKEWLEKLPLNIGRWAGNYAFFYVLHRVLTEYRPNKILEFGLGESSKFINATLKNELTESTHKIIEESSEWKSQFMNNHNLSSHSEIIICPLKKEEVKSFSVNVYDGIDKYTKNKFDLYVVDGPFGSEHYSRYDIVKLANIYAFVNCNILKLQTSLLLYLMITIEKANKTRLMNYLFCLRSRILQFTKAYMLALNVF